MFHVHPENFREVTFPAYTGKFAGLSIKRNSIYPNNISYTVLHRNYRHWLKLAPAIEVIWCKNCNKNSHNKI